MGYSRKKTIRVGGISWGYGVSRGIEEITSEISLGLIENNVGFPELIKKESCGISKGLGFRS